MKIFKAAVYAVSIILLVWFVLSWIEVMSVRFDPNPVYSDLNLFSLLVKGGVMR